MLPVVATLQQHWPHCKITWIIGRIEHQLVKNLPDIEFIVFDKANGFGEYRSIQRKLGQRHFDILFMMQVALRANLLSWLVPARVKIGFDRARSRDLQHVFSNARIKGQARVHVLDGFFQFLEYFGVTRRTMNWMLKAQPESTAWARERLASKPCVAINPCSSVRKNNWRNWPEAFYAQVIDYLVAECNTAVVLTGGPSAEEKAFAERILQQTNQPVTNLVGETSLDQLLAVLEQSQCLIAPDTGPAHMGTVAGIPVIGLYASSNPLRTGPYNSQQFVVNAYPEALQQYQGKTVEQASWGQRVRHPEVMRSIQPQQLIERLGILGISALG